MEATELRIGSIVLDTDILNDIRITGINIPGFNKNDRISYDMLSDSNFGRTGLDRIEGIPLTEEWLNKLDGDYKIEGIARDHIIIRWQDRLPNTQRITNFLGISIIKLRYVHRFQNLYFELTRKELTTKTINHV